MRTWLDETHVFKETKVSDIKVGDEVYFAWSASKEKFTVLATLGEWIWCLRKDGGAGVPATYAVSEARKVRPEFEAGKKYVHSTDNRGTIYEVLRTDPTSDQALLVWQARGSGKNASTWVNQDRAQYYTEA